VRALASSRTLRQLRLLYLPGHTQITDLGFGLLRTSSGFRLVNDPQQRPPRDL
jgi:hypothetical protein